MTKLLYDIIIVAWILCLWYIVFHKIKEYFFLLFFLLFEHTWIALSSLYIENGIYLISIYKTSYFNGATLRLVAILSVFYFFTVWGLVSNKKGKQYTLKNIILENNECSGCNKDLWLNVMLFVDIYCLIDALISGNIITNPEVTRGNYISMFSTLPFVHYFDMLINGFAFVAGMILWDSLKINDIRRRNKAILFLLGSIIYRFLMGFSTSGNIPSMIAFAIPILTQMKLKKIKIKKTVKLSICILIGIILLLKLFDLSKNTGLYSSVISTESAIGKFIYRALALQGEVWWGTDEKYSAVSTVDFSQISKEISSFLFSDRKYDAGIYYLMGQLGHPFTAGDQYTLNCGYPAILTAIFGFSIWIFLIAALGGLIVSKSIIYTYGWLMQERYCHSFFAYCILYDFQIAFYMGGLFYFKSLKIIVCVFGLLMLKIFTQNKRIRLVISK